MAKLRKRRRAAPAACKDHPVARAFAAPQRDHPRQDIPPAIRADVLRKRGERKK